MPVDICWENASKTISEFAPSALVGNYGNSTAGDVVVRDADTPSLTSPDDG